MTISSTIRFKLYAISIPASIVLIAAMSSKSTTRTPTNPPLGVLASRAEWRQQLDSLPDRGQSGRIPSIFFAHGSPTLISPKSQTTRRVGPMNSKILSPDGLLNEFLEDLGKTLVEKYRPRGIVVFSAHWDDPELLVTDYGSENPLLYDYYGFPESFYEFTYRSRGDPDLSRLIVDTFESNGLSARTTTLSETRGRDGRPQRRRPAGFVEAGLDHGVFIPFKRMFPDKDGEPFDIPIVVVSMAQDLSPDPQWELGAALKSLRDQGILILAGGLTVHDFGDFTSFDQSQAKPLYHVWNDKIIEAVTKQGTAEERKEALYSLMDEPEFHIAHRPQPDHFVPLYIAAGAGEDGEARLLSGMYGATTVAFGL